MFIFNLYTQTRNPRNYVVQSCYKRKNMTVDLANNHTSGDIFCLNAPNAPKLRKNDGSEIYSVGGVCLTKLHRRREPVNHFFEDGSQKVVTHLWEKSESEIVRDDLEAEEEADEIRRREAEDLEISTQTPEGDEFKTYTLAEAKDIFKHEDQVFTLAEAKDVFKHEDQVFTLAEAKDVFKHENQVFTLAEAKDIFKHEDQVFTLAEAKEIFEHEGQAEELQEIEDSLALKKKDPTVSMISPVRHRRNPVTGVGLEHDEIHSKKHFNGEMLGDFW